MGFRHVEESGDTLRPLTVADIESKVATVVNRFAVRSQVRHGVLPESRWRGALREMCGEAHTDGVPPEQLLVELKRALSILCDACSVPRGQERDAFTSRVVTLCIEEYYADRRSDIRS